MLLKDLVEAIDGVDIEGENDIEITNIAADSRDCEKGSLFIALKGNDGDGKDFVKHALRNKAVAILTDSAYDGACDATIIRCDDPRAVQTAIARKFYGDHPEHILAVTGTNGKSSVVHFVREILQRLGKKAGSIGTLGTFNVEGERKKGSLTTPDNVRLHLELAALKAEGAEYVVMEASSHGLHQGRLNGIVPKIAGFTNLSHDHLDYHGSMEEYFAAKMELFKSVMPKGKAIINADIEEFDDVKAAASAHEISTFGAKGDVKLNKVEPLDGGMQIDCEFAGKKYSMQTKLMGDFQAENVLCAMGMVHALGFDMADIAKSIEGIASVKGRMDLVARNPLGAPVVVDYAHTPAALERVLKSLRPHVKGSLVVVFGCGGERDKEKRPLMGKIAAEFADKVLVTDDNPRMESAESIRAEILEGCEGGIEIPNRKEAIGQAVNLLEADDLLLISGKGHEDFQLVGRRKYRFDDSEVARRAIGVPLWSGKEVIAAVSGKADNDDWTAYGISIDTRTLKKGDLFIALKGENFDGHDYVAEALEKGAAAAIVQKKPAGVKAGASLVKVTRVEKALREMAIARRSAVNAKIIAVTGSVGKTTVKDALALILGYQGKSHGTQGNLNNHIGLPLSMARMPLDADYGVFELGMSAKGELKELSNLLKPDVALITAVEEAHLEFFDSIVGIADAKAEIFEGLNKSGTAIVPFDSALLPRLAGIAHKLGVDDIRSFGVGEFAKYRLVSGREYSDGIKVETNCNGEELRFKMSLLGRHNAINAVAILAALDAVGADLKQAARTFIKVRAGNGRGRLHRLRIDNNRVTMIDDSYNASPSSMKAALDVLGTVGYDTRGRLVAVLGDMLELGESAAQLHKDLAAQVIKNGVSVLVTAGDLMKNLHDELPDDLEIEKSHVETIAEIVPLLKEKTKRGDVVLLKGSHGSDIWQVADTLKSEGR